MTAAEIWRTILQFLVAVGTGVLLATVARFFTKRDKGVEDQLAYKAKQMDVEAGFRDRLVSENDRLYEKLRQVQKNCDERHDEMEQEHARELASRELYIATLRRALKRAGQEIPERPENQAESA